MYNFIRPKRIFSTTRSRSASGFTLIELMVTTSLLAISLAITVPRLATMGGTFDRMNSRAYLLQDLKRAQAYTITEGCRGIITISPDGRSYEFGCDYLTYDTNTPPVADSVNFVRNLPNQITVSTDATIIFNSRGQVVDETGILESRTLSLVDEYEGAPSIFANGSISGTGVFSYN